MGLTTAERQRRYRQKKYTLIESLPKVPCACGCGELISILNKKNILAQYKHGHNPHGMITRFVKGQRSIYKGISTRFLYKNGNKGKKLNPESIEKRQATRKLLHPEYKRGWCHKPLTLALMTKINQEKALHGEKNPAWLGGKSFEDYGIEFNDCLKQLIKKRDGGACVSCGSSSSVLIVHHIDANKKNNVPANLQTLCKPCHGRLHGRVLQNLRAGRS